MLSRQSPDAFLNDLHQYQLGYFWTDSTGRESCGALVLGIICDEYILSDGRLMFMSHSTVTLTLLTFAVAAIC